MDVAFKFFSITKKLLKTNNITVYILIQYILCTQRSFLCDSLLEPFDWLENQMQLHGAGSGPL